MSGGFCPWDPADVTPGLNLLLAWTSEPWPEGLTSPTRNCGVPVALLLSSAFVQAPLEMVHSRMGGDTSHPWSPGFCVTSGHSRWGGMFAGAVEEVGIRWLLP